MIRRSVIFLFYVLTFSAFSQDLEYARKVVDTLSSPSMHGRGYVNDGHQKAAEYIAREFELHGLKDNGHGHFQSFNVDVNTYPGELSVTIEGELLEPGIDYLVDPSSPSISGSFPIIELHWDEILDGTWIQKAQVQERKFILVDERVRSEYSEEDLKKVRGTVTGITNFPGLPVHGILVLTNDKLTWRLSGKRAGRPVFVIKKDLDSERINDIRLIVRSEFLKAHEVHNVVGYIPGRSDSTIMITAHYDHLGRMGTDTYFPGANDNASGVAMLLNLAKHYSGSTPDYTMVFIAFGGEEIGLKGSQHYISNPIFPLGQIKFLLNFDIAGTGDDGIQVVNGSVYPEKFKRLQEINEKQGLLKQVKVRGEACNSDHCPFHMRGVPCFYIYTLGGIQAYHDVHDRPDTLPLTEFKDLFRLVVEFVDSLQD